MGLMENATFVIADAKARLGEKIMVNYTPTEWKMGDTDWEFVCVHPSSHTDSAVIRQHLDARGYNQDEESIQICDDCDEALEWDEVK